jgi:hydroxyacylglutathione hydrolase
MKIAEGIHLIASGRLGVSLTHPADCNAYAVRCGEAGYILIDSGAGIDSGRILDVLRDDGIEARQIRALLLTHYHLDHCGGASALRDALGIEVWAGPMTAGVLSAGDEESISLAAAKRAGIYPAEVELASCPVSRILEPGAAIEIGDVCITPIAAAGHSRDMTCYLLRQQTRSMLFAGDVIFAGGRISLQDTWDCDVPAYTRSLRELARLEFDMMFPGHGPWRLQEARQDMRDAMSFLDRLLLPPNL